MRFLLQHFLQLSMSQSRTQSRLVSTNSQPTLSQPYLNLHPRVHEARRVVVVVAGIPASWVMRQHRTSKRALESRAPAHTKQLEYSRTITRVCVTNIVLYYYPFRGLNEYPFINCSSFNESKSITPYSTDERGNRSTKAILLGVKFKIFILQNHFYRSCSRSVYFINSLQNYHEIKIE